MFHEHCYTFLRQRKPVESDRHNIHTTGSSMFEGSSPDVSPSKSHFHSLRISVVIFYRMNILLPSSKNYLRNYIPRRSNLLPDRWTCFSFRYTDNTQKRFMEKCSRTVAQTTSTAIYILFWVYVE